MKKLLPLLGMLLLLTGCNSVQPTEPDESQPEEITTEMEYTISPDFTTAAPKETEPVTETEPLSGRLQYRAHLEALLERLTDPGSDDTTGTETTEPETEPAAPATEPGTEPTEPETGSPENCFAICDIDGDGREELIVLYTDADGMTEYILEADGEEFRAHAETVFYDNGAAVAFQLAEATESFVPYSLYQYDDERDGYYEVAYVKALERAALEEAGLADEYPEEADTSESGMVYFIGNDTPMDVTEYELWCESWRKDAVVKEIPFVPLTSENIAEIGSYAD